MYIGPWQEYKLAKIQDAAIQKLRLEWETKLQAQLRDEERYTLFTSSLRFGDLHTHSFDLVVFVK